jgi:pimeloyl-ACP methyl ester carboxylesterase
LTSDPVLVASDDLSLRGTARGPRDGATVLLLHGGGQTRHSWSAVADRLADVGHRAVAMDLRGHGESDWAADGDYSIGAFARDVEAMVAHLGRAPVVVGASLGGMAALVAEGEATIELSSGLVLVDIAPQMEPAGVDRIVSFMTAHTKGFASLDEAADAIATYRPDRPRPADLRGLEKNLRHGPDGRWRWHWDPGFLAPDRGPSNRTDPARLDDAARRVRVPTLLVRGRRSDLLSEAGAQHFLDLVPHARFVDVADAGHMVVGDRNDAFATAVLDFVARVHEADTEEGVA